MIIVEPKGGLGNRLRTITAVYEGCLKNNQTMLVLWNVDKHCYMKFNQFFLKPRNLHVIDMTDFKKKFTFKINFFKNYYLVENDLNRNKLDLENKLPEAYIYEYIKASQNGKVYIHTENSLREEYWFNDFSIIKLRRNIRKHVDAFLFRIKNIENDRVIGVHIRRTDHKPAIENSGTDWFIDEMDKLLEKYSAPVFFVCSDDENEKKRLRERYNNERECVMTCDTVLDRSSIDGMEDACVEMFILSECDEIIGSYGSSFSKMAAGIRNIPYKDTRQEFNRDEEDLLHE